MNIELIVQQLYQELCVPLKVSTQIDTKISEDNETLSYLQQKINDQSTLLYSEDKMHVNKHHSFRWTENLHRKFCLICMSLHWANARPKYIRKFMPELSDSVIASHLQKTRNEMQNHIIENNVIPQQFKNDSAFIAIYNYWKQNNSRLSDMEIKQVLVM
ncbi:Conserved_hypothetical protein [Hexamita inflata]|uniref:Uncharacterized protein n=1 Tax=Hexamita inflata TaxID=28002 RepID=A0AA86P8H7_9EUKA|nr:Conserved hypothetical protein [Hexamita inflata]